MRARLQLYPFQREGVAFLTSQYHCLLADDMGLGKTVQAIEAMNVLGAKSIIVICPATVKINWAREIAEWAANPQTVCIISSGKDKIPPGATVVIVNYELLLRDSVYRQLVARGKSIGYDVAVMDEAHYLKTLSAKRTRRVLGRSSFLHNAKYKWALTGTPIPNRPAEVYPLVYTLAPECIEPYLSWAAFGEHFCNGHRDVYGGLNFKGYSNTEELQERLKPFMLRRTKDQVLDQLPDKVESIIELDVTPPSTLETGHIATVRRELAVAKIPMATKHISDLLCDIDKVVVFAHHRDVIEQLEEALSDYDPVILYGGMSVEQKQESIDGFINNPNTRVFIAQTLAGGTGVNGLQGVCNYVVFVELDWSPGVMDQAIDRLRRIGQRHPVFVQYLAVPDSLDTVIDRALTCKRHVISQIVKPDEVNTMAELTPETQLLLAQAMSSIATTLESLAKVITGGSAPEAPAKGKKASAKKAEPVADPEVEAPKTPEAVEVEKPKVTEEDVRRAAGVFIKATPDQDGNRAIINEQIWPKFGATALVNLDPKHYEAAIAEMEKGPNAFAPVDVAAGI